MLVFQQKNAMDEIYAGVPAEERDGVATSNHLRQVAAT